MNGIHAAFTVRIGKDTEPRPDNRPPIYPFTGWYCDGRASKWSYLKARHGTQETELLKGRFEHRRTEGDYMAVLLDAATLEEWRSVVLATVAAAKAGDPSARAWLAQYLVGKPGATAPAPLTVVVQQLSGRDPLVDRLAKPHIDRMEYPSLHADDGMKDAVKALVADELRGTGSTEIKHAGNRRKRRRDKAFGGIVGILSMSVRQLITGKSNGRAG